MQLDHTRLHSSLLRGFRSKATSLSASPRVVSQSYSANLSRSVFKLPKPGRLDKKLRCDIAQIQESIEKEKVDLRWTQAGSMLADCLTKKGVNPDPLLQVLRTGKLPSLDITN